MRGKHQVSKWLCTTVITSTHATRTQCTDPVLGRDFLLERFHLLLVAGLDALVLLFRVDEALLGRLELLSVGVGGLCELLPRRYVPINRSTSAPLRGASESASRS